MTSSAESFLCRAPSSCEMVLWKFPSTSQTSKNTQRPQTFNAHIPALRRFMTISDPIIPATQNPLRMSRHERKQMIARKEQNHSSDVDCCCFVCYCPRSYSTTTADHADSADALNSSAFSMSDMNCGRHFSDRYSFCSRHD